MVGLLCPSIDDGRRRATQKAKIREPCRYGTMAVCSIIVVLLAILVGLLLSSIPTKVGFYRWLATRDPSNPKYIGFSPAMNHGVGWGYSFEELYRQNLTGQNAIVTGANSGLGFDVSLVLSKLGASVVMACRNEARCEKAAQDIRQHQDIKGDVVPMHLELSSLRSVKRFANEYSKRVGKDSALDMLFLNAGIGSQTPDNADKFLLSEDGIELVFATNVVGHHLLYKLLHSQLENSEMVRIVLTSSCASFDTFDYKVATDIATLNNEEVTMQSHGKLYGQSKLAQIMWAKKLTRTNGPDSAIYVNSAHPGAVATQIWYKLPDTTSWFVNKIYGILRSMQPSMWSSDVAALTLLYLGVATDDIQKRNIRGRYFHPIAIEVVNELSLDENLQDKVWAFLDDIV